MEMFHSISKKNNDNNIKEKKKGRWVSGWVGRKRERHTEKEKKWRKEGRKGGTEEERVGCVTLEDLIKQ